MKTNYNTSGSFFNKKDLQRFKNKIPAYITERLSKYLHTHKKKKLVIFHRKHRELRDPFGDFAG